MENFTVGIYLVSFLFYLLACFFKQKFFPKIALLSLSLGFLGCLFLVIRHFFQTQRLPLTNTSETLLFAATIIGLIFLAVNYKNKLAKVIGLLVSLIASLALISSLWLARSSPMPLLPALQSKWLVFHVSSCIIAYCFFTIAFVTALIYIVNRESRSSDILSITHSSVSIGFLFLTLGIILGSIWGKFAWGHWWNWDPKEVWALITWFIYGYYFHAFLAKKHSEEKLCWIAIAGFLSCLFTYFGVNFLLKGLHSYA
ncbi:MAG: cytochrome c biogenesis protein CcsA [Omnitrophica bacterium]|nr:cytochrome c biogenesis protein CcsA [Candidatus Omnitrophota bacterium]